MPSVTARVPAKINLSLAVGPRRPDGYHALATVYQSVGLCDEVRAAPREDDHISVSVRFDADRTVEAALVPEDASNLAVQAALRLREAIGGSSGADLAIRKAIPVAGGMAGGSADAAAALVACDALWGSNASRSTLDEIAASLGSDVPFCLHGGNAVGGGRGEKVSPVLARGHYQWVFAIADHGLSTAAVYAEFDELNDHHVAPEPEIGDDLMTALRSGDAPALGRALHNDLQDAALALRPELRQTLDVGRDCDALGGIVSGSGPTVMFLASDEKHAMDIAVALASSRVCADVVQALGPVAGARLL